MERFVILCKSRKAAVTALAYKFIFGAALEFPRFPRRRFLPQIETVLVEPVLAQSTLRHLAGGVIRLVTATVPILKIMRVVGVVADVEFIFVGIQAALIFGAGVTAVATKVAFRVEFDDGIAACRVATVAASGAKPEAASGFSHALATSVEVLPDVTEVVSAGANNRLLHPSSGTTLLTAHGHGGYERARGQRAVGEDDPYGTKGLQEWSKVE